MTRNENVAEAVQRLPGPRPSVQSDQLLVQRADRFSAQARNQALQAVELGL